MGMNFYDLIEFAKREQCSDVHITVGTGDPPVRQA